MLAWTALAGEARAFNAAPYFPLIGTPTWTYVRDGVSVTRSILGTGAINGAAVVVIGSSDGNQYYYSNGALGIREHGAYNASVPISGIGTVTASGTSSPPVTLLPADVTLGVSTTSSGTMSFFYSSIGSVPCTYSATATPLAFETVSVAAGAFQNALRVRTVVQSSCTLTYRGKTATVATTDDSSTWLAAGVGIIKELATTTGTTTPQGGTASISTTSHSTELAGSSLVTPPQQFAFTSLTDVATNTLFTSNAVTITGNNAGATVTITGGEYSVDGGAFTSQAGTVYAGQRIIVRVRSAMGLGSFSTATLNVGSVSGSFSVRTATTLRIVAPTFPPITNAPFDSWVVSDPVTIDSNGPALVITAQGEFSIDGGAFTNIGTVNPGQSVQLRVKTGTEFGHTYSMLIQFAEFADVWSTFSATTASPSVPSFAFAPMVGVAPNTVVTSPPITLTGFNLAVPISIIGGGEYSINGGTYTSSPGLLSPGQNVTVHITSPATNDSVATAGLTVGNRFAKFTVLTPLDAGPLTAIYVNTSPGDQAGFGLSYLAVAGGGFATTVLADKLQNALNFVLNSSDLMRSLWATITAPQGGTLTPGDFPNAEAAFSGSATTPGLSLVINSHGCQAPPGHLQILEATADGQGVIQSFAANFDLPCSNNAVPLATAQVRYNSSIPLDFNFSFPPDPFSFAPKSGTAFFSTINSDPITVSGLSTQAAISVTGGSYSVNGGTFTNVPGYVAAGDQVVAQVTTGGNSLFQSCATVTIAGLSAPFCATTASYVPPAAFQFDALSNVQFGQNVVSNPVTLASAGVVPISIDGGSYSVNGGAYTTAPGSVANGDSVTVRMTASPASATQACATLTIGGVAGPFCATTMQFTPPSPKLIIPILLDD